MSAAGQGGIGGGRGCTRPWRCTDSTEPRHLGEDGVGPGAGESWVWHCVVGAGVTGLETMEGYWGAGIIMQTQRAEEGGAEDKNVHGPEPDVSAGERLPFPAESPVLPPRKFSSLGLRPPTAFALEFS